MDIIWSKKTTNKLRKRFVIIGTVSVLIFFLLIVSIISIINYNSMIQDIDKVIDVISKPEIPFFKEREDNREFREEFRKFLPPNMSLEVPYETRFFSVEVSSTGQLITNDVSRIVTISDYDIEYFVRKAEKRNSEYGFVDQFRFKRIDDITHTKYMFIDCGRKLEYFYNTLKITYIITLIGCAISCVVFIVVSKKVVSPIVDSYNRQKSFITNASHEIKTPLTIISANVDLLETKYKKNESIKDIKKQTLRLANLTNNLVYLSKIDEDGYSFNKIDIPFSDLAKEVVESFKSTIYKNNLKLNVNIEPLLTIYADQNSIDRLLNIVIENSIKYCSKKGEISIKLTSNSRKVFFTITNDINDSINENEIKNLFERFYRIDKSRNSDIGGHGIGLSIAKSITDYNNGKIKANILSKNKFSIEISFKKIFYK